MKKNDKSLQHYIKNFPDQIQDQIDDIMDYFDFERVEKVMKFLDWKWYTTGGTTEVPDIYEIRRTARNFLKDATFKLLGKEDTQEWGVGSGGLEVRCFVCDFDEEEFSDWKDDAAHQVVVTLKFVLEEANTYR